LRIHAQVCGKIAPQFPAQFIETHVPLTIAHVPGFGLADAACILATTQVNRLSARTAFVMVFMGYFSFVLV
jgi:hypothetical protein